jgi:hypothetical protein
MKSAPGTRQADGLHLSETSLKTGVNVSLIQPRTRQHPCERVFSLLVLQVSISSTFFAQKKVKKVGCQNLFYTPIVKPFFLKIISFG